MKKLRCVFLILCLCMGTLVSMAAKGYAYTSNGKSYPLVVNMNGSHGKYAYQSTLKRKGQNNRCSWLYFSGYDSDGDIVVKDCNGKVVEYWTYTGMSMRGGCTTYEVTTVNGKTFSVSVY